jgi:hypothetical protein
MPDDARLRTLLEQYTEPTLLEPPSHARLRMLERLPNQPPAQAAHTARRMARQRMIGGVGLLAGVLALVVLGSNAIFADSGSLAAVFGTTGSGPGYLVLVLVLLAKPLLHALLSVGVPLLITWLVLGGGLAWLWWRLVQRAPLVHPSRI